MNTEYIRNLHSNYERIYLEEKPEENKYQYCILTRGGIKGLLPCSLRYLDGEAYLYYDITSMQNIVQIHQKGSISREWLLKFMDSIQRLQQELGRYLLQEDNVLWSPEQVFQDLESNVFSYLYLPYYQGPSDWMKLMGFLVEKIDYEDEKLVECVYKMYEQSERAGLVYLQEQIFKDVKLLETQESDKSVYGERTVEPVSRMNALPTEEDAEEKEDTPRMKKQVSEPWQDYREGAAEVPAKTKKKFTLFENKKNKKTKEQEQRDEYRESMQQAMMVYHVAEDTPFEEYGRTAFIGERPEKRELTHRLYFADGRKASDLENSNLLIGKYKDKVDLYLEDDSISRMHARILKDHTGVLYLEDSNSTNGSFLNGERLQPYERKEIKPGDELKFGNQVMYYR